MKLLVFVTLLLLQKYLTLTQKCVDLERYIKYWNALAMIFFKEWEGGVVFSF